MSVYVWLAIALVAALIEVFSSAFITLWFVIAALVSFVLGMLNMGAEVQWICFAVISLLCLLVLRPIALKRANRGPSEEPTPVGERAVVIQEIGEKSLGRVELSNHMTWAAKSAHEEVLSCGQTVIVVGQESAKLIVERA